MPRSADDNKKLFPDKESRYKCWDARDKFWECLDSKDPSACAEMRGKYEEACPNAWVKHFDRKREYLKFKEKVKEGYEPLSELKS